MIRTGRVRGGYDVYLRVQGLDALAAQLEEAGGPPRSLPPDLDLETDTFLFLRAITYVSLFIGVLLVWLPARVLRWSGTVQPVRISAAQLGGMLIGASGGVLALWCIVTFVAIGRGTPAPFDPPRQLVVVGPYRLVRNPMYLGAGLALGGAALFYESWALLGYCAAFLLVTHLFVVAYEEPTLRADFGTSYERYCARVHRWWPRRRDG